MPFHLTDTEWVMIVVAAIYLFECACWVPRDALCLSTLLGRFRALQSATFMGNEQKKLVLGNPSPLARCFVCETWPFAISAEGICYAEGMRLAGDGSSLRFLAFEDVASTIVTMEKEVHAGGTAIAGCFSEEHAARLAAMLSEVAAVPAADRGKLIGDHLDRWTDNAAAAARYTELKKLVIALRSSGLTFFLLAFVVGPVLYFPPWRLSWRVVAAYFLVLFMTWMLAVWDYSVCRKQLLGEPFSKRFRHVGMLLLSPAGAMRAAEVLLRDGLSAFHPLAAAAALCTKDRLAALARPALLALEHPKPSELPRDPAPQRVDEWFRKKLLKRLNALLRRAEVEPDDLRRPPEALEDSRSYCPRCRNQYVHAEGSCADCGGIALAAYAERAETVSQP